VIEPVTPDRWSDIEALFERPGPRGGTPIPGNCWCMGWRDRQPFRQVRKDAFKDLVVGGELPGLLAYDDDFTPVGWIAVAPRDDQARLAASRMVRGLRGTEGDAENVFAITCFYVDPDARNQGISNALLDAALEDAARRGATVVEAYPKADLPPHARKGGKAEQNESFMGRRHQFESRGFTLARDAGARLVLRRRVDDLQG
jgi:GNAT superfamily N-acetyltransferase